MKIIVTGASKGIGRGITRVLAKEGHQVGMLARSKEHLQEVQALSHQWKGDCHFETCDIRDSNQVGASIENLVRKMNGIDGLINNAGLVIKKSILELSIEEWLALMETNVNGVFYATRTVLPYLQKNGKGHIINISSISGRVPLPGGSGYAASKYAITGFSESIFQEVRQFGIKVSTIFPGSVDTDSHPTSSSRSQSWMVTPEEVGQACLELLNTSPQNCISRLELRPLKLPETKKK